MGVRLALYQIGVASGDLIVAASVLYALPPQSTTVGYLHSLGIYLLALVARGDQRAWRNRSARTNGHPAAAAKQSGIRARWVAGLSLHFFSAATCCGGHVVRRS